MKAVLELEGLKKESVLVKVLDNEAYKFILKSKLKEPKRPAVTATKKSRLEFETKLEEHKNENKYNRGRGMCSLGMWIQILETDKEEIISEVYVDIYRFSRKFIGLAPKFFSR